jgi:hypothetical protein
MADARRILALAGLVVLLAFTVSAFGDEPTTDREPPLLLYFETDGKRIPVELEKPFNPAALAGTRTATLRAEPYRVFPYAGLSFRYPRGYAYSFETALGNPAVSIWEVEGTDFKILVQLFRGVDDHEGIRQAVMDGLLERYAGARVRQLDTKFECEGTTLKGRKLEVTLAQTVMHQDLFSFPSGGDSVVLILQDTPQANGRPSADRNNAEMMLRQSLRLPAK